MGIAQNTILSLRQVTKKYYGVPAIENISLDIVQGDIHGLVGENGAGKSTLIKSIAGAIPIDSGEIWYKGKPLQLNGPSDAIKNGIGVVYQEFNLFPNLAAYENIFFGVERKRNGLLDRPLMIKESEKILDSLGFHFDVTEKVSRLSTGFQQATEIAKCLNHKVELMIMDEPSAPLTEHEVDNMFEVVRKLNAKGITIIYISHKLNEIFDLTNKITVLRDGHLIKTISTNEATENGLIKAMVGREIDSIYPEKTYNHGNKILECKHLEGSKVHDVSFFLNKGEILGFAGLVGAGRTETMRLVFGADKKISGMIFVDGKEVRIANPADAIACKIGLIPEDRKVQGLILNKDIYLNSLLPSIDTYTRHVFIDFKRSRSDIEEYFKLLKVKATGLDQLVRNLSGGNQQKIVLEKWLLKNCDILILDEPTRGIDVGTKQEIYQLIKQLANEGKSIIMISSELPELIGVCHRILVMREGHITGELAAEEISQEKIIALAS